MNKTISHWSELSSWPGLPSFMFEVFKLILSNTNKLSFNTTSTGAATWKNGQAGPIGCWLRQKMWRFIKCQPARWAASLNPQTDTEETKRYHHPPPTPHIRSKVLIAFLGAASDIYVRLFTVVNSSVKTLKTGYNPPIRNCVQTRDKRGTREGPHP